MVASAVFNNEYLVRTIKERVEAVRKSSFGKSCERALRDTHHSYTEVAGQPHQEREAQSMKLIKATTPLSHFLRVLRSFVVFSISTAKVLESITTP